VSGGRAATGNAIGWAIGPEPSYGVPSSSYVSHDPVLPVSGSLVPSEIASAAVNRKGFIVPGVAGSKSGPVEWTVEMQADALLELSHHVIGATEKTELEAGEVFQYVNDPPPLTDFVDTSFSVIVAKEPVERSVAHGVRFGMIEMAIGANAIVTAKLTGSASHGTLLSPSATPAPGNTGSYVLGPFLRGLLLNRVPADHVHLRVVRDVAGGGLQWSVFRGGAVPDFTGAPVVDVVYADGNAVWQNTQDQVGTDLGSWGGGNKDPLEALWPGNQAAHADLEIGDEFFFTAAWSFPVVAAFQAGSSSRFTSAHWLVRARPAGDAGPYQELGEINSGSIKLENPLEPRTGNGSKYFTRIERPGPLRPTVAMKRAFTDSFFADLFDAHARVDLVLELVGGQIGTGAFRETWRAYLPSAAITKDDRPAGNAGILDEDLEFVGETDDSGNSPVVITSITTRDWTPPA